MYSVLRFRGGSSSESICFLSIDEFQWFLIALSVLLRQKTLALHDCLTYVLVMYMSSITNHHP